jgi:uncharacterized protein YggE
MMATVQVEGNAKASAFPDRVQLDLVVNENGTEYGKVSTDLDIKVRSLKDALAACGLDRSSIVTADFGIRDEHDYDGKKRVFLGYKAHHKVRVTFPMDKERINVAVAACLSSSAKPEVVIEFYVQDTLPLRDEALAKAVTAAKTKAELLVAATGGRLGDLVDIVYGKRVESSSRSRQFDIGSTGETDYCMSFSAEEISPSMVVVEEAVSATWQVVQ